MKKLIAVLITVSVILSPVYACAGEAHISYIPSTNSSIQVNGNYNKLTDYYEITLGIPELDSVQLPGGITLHGSNTSNADKGKRIIIVPVTSTDEPAAYKWLCSNLPKADKRSVPYYLGFYDADDNHTQPEGSVIITLTIQDGYSNTKLYYMDAGGRLKQLRYSAQSGSAQFTINTTGYYLFIKASQAGNNPVTPAGYDKPDSSNSPKTGDSSNLYLWLVLFASSCCTLGLALVLVFKRRRGKQF